jgi:hypothetical protein
MLDCTGSDEGRSGGPRTADRGQRTEDNVVDDDVDLACRLAGLTPHELWLRYLALGGGRSEAELEARVRGLPWVATDEAVLAVAVREALHDVGLSSRTASPPPATLATQHFRDSAALWRRAAEAQRRAARVRARAAAAQALARDLIAERHSPDPWAREVRRLRRQVLGTVA